MKRILNVFLSLTLVISLTFGTAVSAEAKAAKTIKVKYTATQNYNYAMQVAKLVNKERKKRNVKALKFSNELTAYAMQRAAETAVYFSHTRPDGTSCLAEKNIYNGENIAYGQDTPKAVMKSWMSSEGHKQNILKSAYHSIGVGCVSVNGIYYWVQVFSYSSLKEFKSTKVSNKAFKIKITKSKARFKILAIDDDNYILDKFTIGNDEYGVKFRVSVYHSDNQSRSTYNAPFVKNSVFIFSSSDSNIISVNKKGSGKVKSKGKVTVSAKSKELNKTVKRNITVKYDSSRDSGGNYDFDDFNNDDGSYFDFDDNNFNIDNIISML